MVKRQTKEEKLTRIADRLLRLYFQLSLSFQKRKPFEIPFQLKEHENYKGLIEFSRIDNSITFGITFLTSNGAPLHRFEVIHVMGTVEKPFSYCAFTSLPYKRGQALDNLKVGFTNQVPFEAYIRQMVLTSCNRDNLLTPLVACLERAVGLIEYEKMFSDWGIWNMVTKLEKQEVCIKSLEVLAPYVMKLKKKLGI